MPDLFWYEPLEDGWQCHTHARLLPRGSPTTWGRVVVQARRTHARSLRSGWLRRWSDEPACLGSHQVKRGEVGDDDRDVEREVTRRVATAHHHRVREARSFTLVTRRGDHLELGDCGRLPTGALQALGVAEGEARDGLCDSFAIRATQPAQRLGGGTADLNPPRPLAQLPVSLSSFSRGMPGSLRAASSAARSSSV